MAATPSRWTGYAFVLLAELHDRGIGVRADRDMAQEYRRRAWLLGPPHGLTTPFADEAERMAYLARPATIAFLRGHAEAPSPPEARVNLALSLLSRAPARPAEAAALLGDPRLSDLPDARAVRVRIALLGSADLVAAARELRPFARYAPPGSESRTVLAEAARRQLAGEASGEARLEAIEWLATLAYGLDPAAVAELMRAVEAVNGGRPPDVLTGPSASAVQERLRAPISDDDYPAAALRNEEQGYVLLRGLIDPRGRLIFTEPLPPAPPRALLGAVRRAYAARPLPPVELGAARTTPYMWVDLPWVTFRIAE